VSEENTKPSLMGIDPTKPFYLAVVSGNEDGSVDRPEGVEACCATEVEAVIKLKEVNEAYPTLDGYVFYCVPVKKVWRGKTRVTSLKGEKP